MSRIRNANEVNAIKCCVKGCNKKIKGLSHAYQHIETQHPQFVVEHVDYKEIQKKKQKEAEILRKRRKVSEEEVVTVEMSELINLKIDFLNKTIPVLIKECKKGEEEEEGVYWKNRLRYSSFEQESLEQIHNPYKEVIIKEEDRMVDTWAKIRNYHSNIKTEESTGDKKQDKTGIALMVNL